MGQSQSTYNVNSLISALKDAHNNKQQYGAVLDNFAKAQAQANKVDLLPDSVTDVICIAAVLFGTAGLVLIYSLYRKFSALDRRTQGEEAFVRHRILGMQLENFKRPPRSAALQGTVPGIADV
jgi:hypothetical protein